MVLLQKPTVKWHQSVNLETAGFPPFTFLFPCCLLRCFQEIITLGSSALQKSREPQGCMCRQVLSWALIPGCAHHDPNWPPLQSNNDDGENLWPSELDCGTSGNKLLVNCGKIPTKELELLSVAGPEGQGNKYLSKIRAIDCLGTELPPNLWLDGGPRPMSRQSRFRGRCRFLPRRDRLSCRV